MSRLAAILRWRWWTVTTARHRDTDLPADRPDWTVDELADMPRVRHPERHLNDQAAEDEAEERRHG